MEPIRLSSGSWNGDLETQGQLDASTEAKEPDPGQQGRLGADVRGQRETANGKAQIVQICRKVTWRLPRDAEDNCLHLGRYSSTQEPVTGFPVSHALSL